MRDLLQIRSFGDDATPSSTSDCPEGQVFNDYDQTCELPTVNIVGTRPSSSSVSKASSGTTSNAALFLVSAAVVVGAFYYLFKDSTKYTSNKRRRKYRHNKLRRGCSRKSVSSNIRKEIHSGRSRKQAVAIALNYARKQGC